MSIIEEIREREKAATPGPWLACGQSGKAPLHKFDKDGLKIEKVNVEKTFCSCGLIFSIPTDGVVATVESLKHDDFGEGFTVEQFERNSSFIQYARADIPFLLRVVEAMMLYIENMEQFLQVEEKKTIEYFEREAAKE